MKSPILKRMTAGLFALSVTLTAAPVLADGELRRLTEGPSISISDTLKLPTERPTIINYPSCPAALQLAQKGATIFRCKTTVPSATVPFVVAQASATSCAPESYWNVGPEVYTQGGGNAVTVHFRCRHTN